MAGTAWRSEGFFSQAGALDAVEQSNRRVVAGGERALREKKWDGESKNVCLTSAQWMPAELEGRQQC